MPSQFGGKPSGVARVAFSLLERLVAVGGHDYILRSAWRAEQLPPGLQHGVELLHIERPRVMIADMVWQAIVMPAICRKAKADLVWNVDTFGAARGGRARVTTVHDLFYRHVDTLGWRARMTMALCYGTILRGSTRVVAISKGTRDELATTFPSVANRLAVITNDATVAASSGATLPREIPERYVLMVGNATPNKNFAAAVAALSLLQANGSAPALVHVGMDDSSMIANAMAAASPPPRLIQLKGIDDARLAALYAHAECLIVPSLSEGFCLPIIEAQALGCPVIVSNQSVMPEVGGEGAIYFDPSDPNSLAVCLTELMADPTGRAALIKRGFHNRSRFSWEASARAYAALFTELLA
ncbi:glycosyltransferase [Novosphingobium sp. Rr 2-17]|uniref:glycosyltransferase family 4 protein n=1 Tax=Novosphingobium sp. Rr 2-17 TaxID=555793 RepID=UPI0002697AE8|nr:glycosyltransferase family 1 protein [Novosphingobium sp. Rr 2-17]EIZ81184.1 glycosyltransferase [Novosphingobium sp. Rr 2-17]